MDADAHHPPIRHITMHPSERAFIRFASVLFLLLATAAPLAGQSHTRYTTTVLRLRADASTSSATLRTMPRGAAVAVRSCANDWCRVTYRGRSGYAAERYLAQRRPALRTRDRGSADGSREPSGDGYVNSRGQWVPSPRRSRGGPPAGATARCRDGTYSFSRTRRGTCSHHGGVAQWL
jgi:uncharacterized protein YraI